MSTIKTNTLTGTTSAGSIVVTGEGGVTTTNLQQGLSKAWIHLTGSGTPTAEDSLNNSSVTDGGTGLFTFNFPSVFGNIHYCASSMAGNAGQTTDGRHQIPNAELTPSAFQVRNVSGANSVQDDANIFIIFHGELGET